MHSILTIIAGRNKRPIEEDIVPIRGLHDTLIRLQAPRPRISSLLAYWRPLIEEH
jgi:hypothetical protein